jgi:hypothetical protein
MVLGTDHVRMALHGRVVNIVDLSVWCIGVELGDEVHFDLAGAASISFADAQGLPVDFESLKTVVVDDLIAVLFEDGTRLMLLNETPS